MPTKEKEHLFVATYNFFKGKLEVKMITALKTISEMESNFDYFMPVQFSEVLKAVNKSFKYQVVKRIKGYYYVGVKKGFNI